MDEEKSESTPSLQDIEGGWATPPPAKAASATTTDEGDRTSTPDLAAVDEGWLDDLFPEAEEPDDEEEEPEHELPDERLDPAAYAEAKKARDELAAARRDKKKAKLEAKRARQRTRAAEARAKQRGKSKGRARPKPKPEPKNARKAAPNLDTVPAADEVETDEPAGVPARKKAGSGAAPARRGIATQWKLLALAIAIFIAAAALAAALAR
jgi:hypothetical protein